MDARLPSQEVIGQRRQAYESWLRGPTRPWPDGHGLVPTRSSPVRWTPPKPLGDSTVALVTTAGAHRRSQEPFAVYDHDGDSSSRAIPGDVDSADLTVTHTHYDTRDALEDVNVILPIDRLRELAEEGVIGRPAPLHFGLMGFIPDPGELVERTAPEMAARLRGEGVDAVVLTGG